MTTPEADGVADDVHQVDDLRLLRTNVTRSGITEDENISHQLGKFAIGDCDEESYSYRSQLPAAMFARSDVSLWSILKQSVGKELSKITMPVVFNEPLTFLQRMVEYLEYASLLIQASQSDNLIERLELVTAFAVSATASNWERTGKPFNPLLGETYELQRPDLGFKIVCEQVSHHPPVSAFHADSEHFILYGSILPKLKFWGKSVEVTPKGKVTLHLLRHNEVYTWHNVNCSVNNVIVGKLWIEHFGTLEVINCQTKHRAVLSFKAGEMFNKDLHKVEGYLYDPSGHKKVKAFYGKWVEALYSYEMDVWEAYGRNSCRGSESPCRLAASLVAKAKLPSLIDKSPQGSEDIPSKGSSCNLHLTGQKLLWEASPRQENSSMYYNFTSFAMTLNEITDSMKNSLPPTDSRLRPDMRRMEDGDIDGAAVEKKRLEERQRLVRKESKRLKEEWQPRWFRMERNPYTDQDDWKFVGEYWKRVWHRCPDIF